MVEVAKFVYRRWFYKPKPDPNLGRTPVQSPELEYWLKFLASLPEEIQVDALSSLTPGQRYRIYSLLEGYGNNNIELRHLTGEALTGLELVRTWAKERSLEAHLVLFNALSDDGQYGVFLRLGKWVKEFSALNNQFLDMGRLQKKHRHLLANLDFRRAVHGALADVYMNWVNSPETSGLDLAQIERAREVGLALRECIPLLGSDVRITALPFHKFTG